MDIAIFYTQCTLILIQILKKRIFLELTVYICSWRVASSVFLVPSVKCRSKAFSISYLLKVHGHHLIMYNKLRINKPLSEGHCLLILVYDALWSDKHLPTFRSKMLPPSSDKSRIEASTRLLDYTHIPGDSILHSYVLRTSNTKIGVWKHIKSLKQGHNHLIIQYNEHRTVTAVSRDSVVGIVTGCELNGWGVGVRVPLQSRIFSSPRRPDWLWGHPASYPMGTGGKAAGAWRWPLTSN
jgi:hypothetical protein